MSNEQINKQRLSKVIQNNNLAHAYLFSGDIGTGKLETAKWLAKSLFCSSENNKPCGQCVNCDRIEHLNHPDVKFISPEGQSIKVSQIQELKEDFNLKSTTGGIKFYCIDQAELMTDSAYNRLLTFLEEPPKNTYAVLITNNVNNINPTIKSRCQILYFNNVSPKFFYDELIKNNISPSQIEVLSYLTNNVHDALKLSTDQEFLEQLTLASQWFELLIKKDNRAFLFVQQKLIASFNNKDEYLRLLDIIFILANNLLKKDNSLEMSFFDNINKAKIKLLNNVNPQNVCEQLAIKRLDILR